MKKFISALTAFIVLLSTVSLCTMSSFAQETTKYWEPRPNPQDALGCVNGEPADGIYMVRDDETDASRIEYLGEGKLTGWEFPTLTEGEDYNIISQYDNTIIVKFTDGAPYINALVDFGDDENVNDVNEQNAVSDDYTASQNDVGTSEAVSQQSSEPVSESSGEAVALSSDKAAEPESDNTKTVIIAVSAAAVVCIAVILIVKNKKSHS